MAVWLLFEAVIAPVLGPRWKREPRERTALLADHVLYGVVAGHRAALSAGERATAR